MILCSGSLHDEKAKFLQIQNMLSQSMIFSRRSGYYTVTERFDLRKSRQCLVGYNHITRITVLSRLSKTYDRAWMKILSTFDVQIIRQCQFFTGYLPLSYQIAFRRVCFLDKFSCHPNPDLIGLCIHVFRNTLIWVPSIH